MSQRRGRPRLGLIRTAVMSVLQSVGLVDPDGSLAVPSSPVAVADGGTGATTAAGARTALAVQGTAEKGAANGYASLDSGGFVPLAQLPASVQTLLGLWDASTNSPTLADGSGDQGDTYIVSVAGSQDLGSGSQAFEVGDAAVYVSGVWVRLGRSDLVSSVAGKTGVVALEAADLTDATATGVALIVAASAAAARSAISAQEANALLSDIAGLSVSEGDLLYVDGSGDIVNLGAGADGQVLTLAGGVPAWAAAAGGGFDDSIYGDGSDGDVVISSFVNLSDHAQYNNLTVNVGSGLNTQGWSVRVKGTLTLNGFLGRSGSSSSGSSGGSAAGSTSNAMFRPGTAGTAAGGGEPDGFDAANNREPGLGGGGGGAANAVENNEPFGPHTDVYNALRPYPVAAGRAYGGGQGGKGGSAVLGTGGGGGGGGAVLFLAAKAIVLGASASLRAAGGNGGNASGANANGGGGGGGGAIIAIYGSESGSISVADACLVQGGTGGSGAGAGSAGPDGSAGNAYLFEVG